MGETDSNNSSKDIHGEESFEDNYFEDDEEVKLEKRSSSASRDSQEGTGLRRRLSKLADADDYEGMDRVQRSYSIFYLLLSLPHSNLVINMWCCEYNSVITVAAFKES